MPSTGTCTGSWTAGTDAGTGTCDKVLVAKTKSSSAVIDTLWHLYSETLECLDYWFLCPSFTVWHYLADLHFISFLTVNVY